MTASPFLSPGCCRNAFLHASFFAIHDMVHAAPVAPKKDQVLKIVNRTSIQIYPSAWQQQSSSSSAACPILKLTIEYRISSSAHHKWKLLSSQGISGDEVIELSNLVNRSIYSLRMTAHTRSPPAVAPVMAEYEARIGIEDPDDHSPHETYSQITKGLLTDPSTVISLASSVFVLLVGFIAVSCLVTYKRRLNQKLTNSQRHKKHHRRTSATSAASTMQSTILTEEPAERRAAAAGGAAAAVTAGAGGHKTPKFNIQKTSLPPIPTEVPGIKNGKGMSQHQSHQVLRVTGQQANVGSGGNAGNKQPAGGILIDSNMGSRKSPFKSDLIRGKLPNVCIPRQQLEEIENDVYNEYDEIAPYATFRLQDGHTSRDDYSDTTDDFKTFREFTVRIGEPAYCFKASNYVSREFNHFFLSIVHAVTC
jgi:hypothetical protein